MTKVVPWITQDEAISMLAQRSNMLSRQAEALRMESTERNVVLIKQFVVLASIHKVADWANHQGWRMNEVRGGERRYTGTDIAELFENPPASVCPELMALVR